MTTDHPNNIKVDTHLGPVFVLFSTRRIFFFFFLKQIEKQGLSVKNNGPYLFKAWRRVAHLLQHGPLDSGLSDVAVVFPRALGATGSSSRSFIPWLIEVRLSHQDKGLH